MSNSHPREGGDLYGLLGLTTSFTIDLAALESAYFAAQRQYHPDRFVGKTQTEKNAALSRSMDINHAYDTLKNPLKRAHYLLSLQGVIVGTEKDSVKPAQSLLMEIMELREEPPEKKIIHAMIEASITRISGLYDKQDWQAMAQETLRLGYLVKIQSDMK